jgi:hypothetical protein
MIKKKMGEEADFNISNYFSYRPTFLNKLVRISPLISSNMMDYFIRHRKKWLAKRWLSVLHLFVVVFIEPISYFHLMLKGFNNRLWLTTRIAFPTFKTKIKERLK